MADYEMLFATLGAELKNHRKLEAVFENFHFVSSSDDAKRLISAEYSDSNIYQETANSIASRTYEGSIAPTMQGLCSTLKQAFEQGWFPVLDSEINTNPDDKASGAIAYNYDGNLNDGTISILSRSGRWGALRNKMIADREVIVKNTVAFGSLVALGTNQGDITLGSVSGADHTLSGTLTLLCTDDTVEAPKFSLINVLSQKIADQTVQTSADGLFSIIPADNAIQLTRSYEDGPTGVSILLNYHAGTTVDPDEVFYTGGGISVLNPTEADSNKGNVYFRLTRQSSDPVWKLEWFRDAARSDLVTQATAYHALPEFFLLGPSGMSIAVGLDTANADTALPNPDDTLANMEFDLGVPRLNDQWTITVTNSEDGLFATKIAHRYRASLNSASEAPGVPPSASLAGVGAGNVEDGDHSYYVSYVVNGVETGATGPSNVVTVADKTSDGKVSVASIPIGGAGTTARKLYRTVAGDTGSPLYLATISDNVTTTYTDNTADGSLGVAALTQVDDSLAFSVSMT